MNNTYSEHSVILHGVNIEWQCSGFTIRLFSEDILLSQGVWIEMISETVLQRNNFKMICI